MQGRHSGWPRQQLQRPPCRPAPGTESSDDTSEPLIGASGLANRSLIADSATRPETLAACFNFVMYRSEVLESFLRELPAAREHIERVTGRDLTDLPANPLTLRPLIAPNRLHKHRVQNKRWNAATILRSVLILTSWHSPEARLRYKLPQEWEALLIAADRYGKRRALAAFMRYAHRLDLTPFAISSDTLLSYIEWMSQQTLDPDPWRTAVLVKVAWEFMRVHHAGWPTQLVRLPPRRASPFATRADLRNEPLIAAGASLRANRALITDEATRPTTLASCLVFVANHPDVPKWLRRDALSAEVALARITGRNAAELPTDLVALKPILAVVQPIRFGLSTKRWQNIRAIVRSVLILCGWLSPDSFKRYVLPPPWADLISAAKDQKLDRALVPFFRFCHRMRLTPDTITAETLHGYMEWVTQSTLKVNARRSVHAVQSAWGRMQRCHGAWPKADIRLASRRIYKRRTDFVPSFYADLNAYLDSLSRYHPRDPTYRHPLSAAAIKIAKHSILRAGTFLANSGTPIEDIPGIPALVIPQAYESILMATLDEGGGRWTILARHIAETLFLAAKRWVKPTEEVLRDLDEQRHCVQVRYSHRRRRDLLAQFATQEDRKELFDLPWRAFEQADKMLKKALAGNGPLQAAAKLHETALALALLFVEPIRIGNLVALDITKHFRRDRRGKLNRIFIGGDEVKNAVTIEILLPEALAIRIQRHLDVFRPILLKGKSSTALFPGKAGLPLGTQALGVRLRRITKQQLGAHFTAQLARHLAAEILLDADVNNLPLAQRLLAHTRPETTEKIYGMPRTSAAQRVYAKLVERDRLGSVTKEQRKDRKKP